MAGLRSFCPCKRASWNLSPSMHGIPSGGGLRRQYALAIGGPNLLSVVGFGDFSSSGSHDRLHSLRVGSTGEEAKIGRRLCLELGFFLEEGRKCRVVNKNRLKAGFRCSATIGATEKAATALPKGATEEDAVYMRIAVQLARKAIGHTSPNPMVGCVIVKDGQIVGRGFHPKAGEPHAEVFALREAGEKAKGATAYVSLEPCNHTGRTPPCSQALVRAQVKRVVVGTVDSNPLVGGMGVQTLQNAGIQVVVGVEEALCQETAETFFHRIATKKPFVTLRCSSVCVNHSVS